MFRFIYLCMIILVTGITKGHTIAETDTLQRHPYPKMVLPIKYPTPTPLFEYMFQSKFNQNHHFLWHWMMHF